MFTGENVPCTHKQPTLLFVLFVNFFLFIFFVSPRKLCCTVCVRTVCEGKALLSLREVRCIQDHIIWYKTLWPNRLMAQTRLLCAAFLATLGFVVL